MWALLQIFLATSIKSSSVVTAVLVVVAHPVLIVVVDPLVPTEAAGVSLHLQAMIAPPALGVKYGLRSHTAIKCWYRMDESYQEEPPYAGLAATSSYNVDPNWYSDTGATDHITSDLDHLVVREQYHGGETVQVGNRACLQIMHIGSYSINIATRSLALDDVLHVPKISIDLLSVSKLSRDNDL